MMTTFSSQEEARRIAAVLLEEKLAACLSLFPSVESHYYWEGKKEVAFEVVALIKTDLFQLENMVARLEELHPYEVPEIVVMTPESVAPAYQKWVTQSLQADS